MSSTNNIINADAIIVGAGLSGAACAKRLADAGFKTIIMEKKSLPRHKICSGILSPRGHRFLIENFGPLPRGILHKPTFCKGVNFHFPSMLSVSMAFHHGATPHLHRKYSDFWAVKRSGAEIHDNTKFTELKDQGRYVDLSAQKNGEKIRYRARYVIGADGPNSPVTRSIYPSYPKQIPWFIVGQKFHEIIECPLDDEYFHFWFHPDLGHYTWSHARGDKQIVGVGFRRGDNFNKRHQGVMDYLEEKHGVRLKPTEESEACPENFGPSLINRYIFGKGNVLVTGQAAGFLNMMAEGMSCALHSGAIAGEAAVESFRYNMPVQQVYRTMIHSEVRRCSDQWNPLKIIFGHPHEADFWAAMKEHPVRDRIIILKDICNFIKIYAPLKWGRQIVWQAICRELRNKYLTSTWY
ncbi:MAG: NAD(P)/FAD-dependent oxidoreductase [Deltaproteobacteria bacterium]|nr:NAD(P)/FAD-dependent oxidoreductase [Deltaproteobacteria bacterium]